MRQPQMLLIHLMSVLLIFVDGLGVGTRGRHNPLHLLGEAAAPLAVFADEEPGLPAGGLLALTDARLGVEGRPQSASGQTTILTGINIPRHLGYHKQGFPNERMREVLREHSLFLKLRELGDGPDLFVNAYHPQFFSVRPRWVAATTVAVEVAGLPFRTFEDLQGGHAVYHDFTNRALCERGVDVPRRTPEEAAAILARLAAAHRFTLYEHFIADRAGHEQDEASALTILGELARFVRTVLALVDLQHTTVLLTSDHGNVEDLSTRNHTLNPVPTLVWGRDKETAVRRIRSLVDITPTILGILTEEGATQ